MRDSGGEVIAWCMDQQATPTVDWTFHCLGMATAAWAIQPVGGAAQWPDAWGAWLLSDQQSPSSPPPPGAPLFWELWIRGQNFGHVAIADDIAGVCWSIDIRRHGCIDRVAINEINRQWGARYVGWSTDLEGVPLPLGVTPPPPPPVNGDDMPMTVWLSTDAPDGSDDETVNAQRWAWSDFIGPFDGVIAGPIEHVTAEYRAQLVASGTWDRLPKKNRDRNNGYVSYRLLGAIPQEGEIGGPKFWTKADFRAADDG